MKKLAVGKAIGFGWDEVIKNFWVWVGIAFVYSLLTSIPYSVGFLLSPLLFAGLIVITLKCLAGKKPDFNELFSQSKYYLNMLGGEILVGLIVIGGLILLVVPGIYWALKYQLLGFFIVDKNMSIKEAMAECGKVTRGVKLRLLVLDLAFIGILILGGLVFGVGILVALPIIWLADAHVYKQLTQ